LIKKNAYFAELDKSHYMNGIKNGKSLDQIYREVYRVYLVEK